MVEFQKRLHLLSGRYYAKIYVFIYLLLVIAEGAAAVFIIKDAFDTDYFERLTTVQTVLFIVFSAAVVLFMVSSTVFVLVSGKCIARGTVVDFNI